MTHGVDLRIVNGQFRLVFIDDIEEAQMDSTNVQEELSRDSHGNLWDKLAKLRDIIPPEERYNVPSYNATWKPGASGPEVQDDPVFTPEEHRDTIAELVGEVKRLQGERQAFASQSTQRLAKIERLQTHNTYESSTVNSERRHNMANDNAKPDPGASGRVAQPTIVTPIRSSLAWRAKLKDAADSRGRSMTAILQEAFDQWCKREIGSTK